MKVERRKEGRTTVLAVSGRVDATSSTELESVVRETVSDMDGSIVLDFTAVDYISSAGLRVLLIGAKGLAGTSRELVVAGANEDVADVIQLTGIERVIKMTDTLQAALAETDG